MHLFSLYLRIIRETQRSEIQFVPAGLTVVWSEKNGSIFYGRGRNSPRIYVPIARPIIFWNCRMIVWSAQRNGLLWREWIFTKRCLALLETQLHQCVRVSVFSMQPVIYSTTRQNVQSSWTLLFHSKISVLTCDKPDREGRTFGSGRSHHFFSQHCISCRVFHNLV